MKLREQLEKELPQVTLLLGPDKSGRKTFAWSLLERHVPHGVDRMWVSRLDIAAVSRIQGFAFTAPHGKLRMVVIELLWASSAALNRLLKLLEEPPETVKFILVARKDPLPTIRSRAEVVTFGISPQDTLSEAQMRSRSAVLAAIKAARSGDSALLRSAMRDWSALDSQMLVGWCSERLSGRWTVFEATDVSTSMQFAQKLLGALTANRHARPRLGARTALEAASRMER